MIGIECPDENAKDSASNHDENDLETVLSTIHTYTVVALTLNGTCNFSGGIRSIGAAAYQLSRPEIQEVGARHEPKKARNMKKLIRDEVST